jgi:hypothetical protein
MLRDSLGDGSSAAAGPGKAPVLAARGRGPDRWMLVGCAVIVASGLFVFYREAVLGKS